MDDQDKVIAFLSRAESYGTPALPVARINTHISAIFLVGDRAFKLKRNVRYSYADFSELWQREKYCKLELELNRRSAPDLYKGVHTITEDEDGRLAFDGQGRVLDWVLEMKRFDQDTLFDRLARSGQLTALQIRTMADVMADLHKRAEVVRVDDGARPVFRILDGILVNLGAFAEFFGGAAVTEISARLRECAEQNRALLNSRALAGKIRRCHGDLHLRNICLIEGKPTLFDCIEFNDDLSCIDVLYDAAFVFMDLIAHGLDDLGNLAFNRYLDLSGEDGGLPLLPLFLSMRAAIRAHICMTTHKENGKPSDLAEARAYLSLAARLLVTQSPRLIAIGGYSGTGKSTLAQSLAAPFRPAPGARVLRSDVIRKRLAGVTPETRLPSSAYSREAARKVYAALQQQAIVALRAHYTVIVDAAFLQAEERDAIADLAKEMGVSFSGLWLHAPADMLMVRVKARQNDASDADTAVLQAQLSRDAGTISWQTIDTSGGTDAVRAMALRIIGECRSRQADEESVSGHEDGGAVETPFS